MSVHVIADAVCPLPGPAYPRRLDRLRFPAGRGTGRKTWHR
jgi:hypothetical protein